MKKVYWFERVGMYLSGIYWGEVEKETKKCYYFKDRDRHNRYSGRITKSLVYESKDELQVQYASAIHDIQNILDEKRKQMDHFCCKKPSIAKELLVEDNDPYRALHKYWRGK